MTKHFSSFQIPLAKSGYYNERTLLDMGTSLLNAQIFIGNHERKSFVGRPGTRKKVPDFPYFPFKQRFKFAHPKWADRRVWFFVWNTLH